MGGDVQVGYDQVVEDISPVRTGGGELVFPRNIAGDPIRVMLPDVTPGNFLEVDFRANLLTKVEDGGTLPSQFKMIAIVSFNGTPPTIGSATSFYIIDSWAGSTLEDNSITKIISIGNVCLVEIPDDATDAIVELAYVSDNQVQVGPGSDFEGNLGLGVTLKATEKVVSVVSQAGPGNLIPTT